VRGRQATLAVALIGLTWVTTVGPAAAGIARCRPDWNAVIDDGVQAAVLDGVSAIDLDDAWAVGYPYGPLGGLVQHWDGRAWTSVPSPPNPYPLLAITDVLAFSDTDVLVGTGDTDANGLVFQWDGVNWAKYFLFGAVDDSTVTSMSARSRDDVWAVGQSHSTGQEDWPGNAAHWNGTGWTAQYLYFDDMTFLDGVAAVGENDAWAVGRALSFADGVEAPTQDLSLVIHWDGASWTEVADADAGLLQDVAGSSSNDVWAVGQDFDGRPYIEHWNGLLWQPSPVPEIGSALLRSVVAPAPNDAWAVGVGSDHGSSVPLILHWNGRSWKAVQAPSYRHWIAELLAVAAAPGGGAWAVGDRAGHGGALRPITQRTC